MAIDPRIVRTQQAVVDAVESLLLEEGWDAVTHQRVAERSGLGRATIYRHWPTTLELICFGLTSMIDRDRSAQPSGDLRKDLIDMVSDLRAEMAPDRMGPVMAALIDRSARDQVFTDLRRELARRTSEPLRQLIIGAKSRGELMEDLVVEDAMAMITGPIFYRTFVNPEPLTDRLVQSVVDSFLAQARVQL